MNLGDLLSLPGEVNTANPVAPLMGGGVEMPGFAGGMFKMPGTGGPTGQQQQQAHHGGFFKEGGTFRNILGAIGDALLVHSGHAPIYAAHMQSKKLGAALANYLGNLDPGLAEIMQENPEVGMSLYKYKHPQAPAGVEGFEYYRNADQKTRADYEKYLKLTHPGISVPGYYDPSQVDLGDGGGDSLPSPANPDEAAKLPPGTKFRLPDGRVGTVPGGQTAPPSGNFP